MSVDKRYKVTEGQIIRQIEQLGSPFFNATELAEGLPITRQAVNNRLEKLESRGIVSRKKRGEQTVGWWLEDTQT